MLYLILVDPLVYEVYGGEILYVSFFCGAFVGPGEVINLINNTYNYECRGHRYQLKEDVTLAKSHLCSSILHLLLRGLCVGKRQGY